MSRGQNQALLRVRVRIRLCCCESGSEPGFVVVSQGQNQALLL